jgi:hypothetical protein
MNQNEKAGRFAEPHVKGVPLLLCNAREASNAKSILTPARKRSRHFRRTES